MKILITGADGSIGDYLSKYLSSSHEVFPFRKSKLDITNKVQCLDTIKSIMPDAVIHCAALTNIDLCERDESLAYTVNTIGSVNIAFACNLIDIPLVYLSTSNVYNGDKTSPYYESDICTPVNVYGKTKLAAENLIRTVCSKYFILRTSWVFGGKNCFVQNIIDKKDIPLFMCSSDISSPTYVKDLAEIIETMLHTPMYGIYNCVNSGAVKKSLFVSKILEHLGIKDEVMEVPEKYIANRALRPQCTIMNTSLLKNCFNIELRSWEEALSEFFKK
jgi:dTDP-4-dehydrorhamnose reductase